MANVYGKMEKLDGFIDFPLTPDVGNLPFQRVDFEVGKESKTEYHVISEESHPEKYLKYKSLFPPVDIPHTLVELIPHTGR